MQLAEFCDQAWLPLLVREAVHDCIGFIHKAFRPYYGITKLLRARIPQNPNQPRLYLDLASGSGSQIQTLYRTEAHLGAPVLPRFILSDLYPLLEDWKRLQAEYGEKKLGYIAEPVSVTNVPDSISRDWTIFTAFHHFAPEIARQLMVQAFEKANSFHIIEETRRTWLSLLSVMLSLPTLLFAPFFARRFSVVKFLITTLIPIVPLMVCFDGIVSCLRSYTREELEAFLPAGAHDQFHIEWHTPRVPLTPFKAALFSLYRITPLPDIAVP